MPWESELSVTRLGLLAQYGGAGDPNPPARLAGGQSGVLARWRRTAAREAGRMDRALVLGKLINRFVRGPLRRLGAKPRGRELVDWRVGSRLLRPGLGAPAQRPALSLGAFRPGRDCGRGWLQECKDFCIFYINKILIPVVVQVGPHGGHCVHHPCGPCTPSSAPPVHVRRVGRDCLLLSPRQAPWLQPRSGPTRLEGAAGRRAQCWGRCSSSSRVSAMPKK